MEQARGRFFETSDKVKLWFSYQQGSSDKVAVLVSGNGVNHTELEDIASCFQHHGFSVLLYDPRGHGYSEKPWNKESYRLGRLAQDLEELLAHNGITVVTTNILLGQSVGALTSVYYQATRENPVFDALILLTPSWCYKETVHDWVPKFIMDRKSRNNDRMTRPSIRRVIVNYIYFPFKKILKRCGIKVDPIDFKSIVPQIRPNKKDYVWSSRVLHFFLSSLRDLWVALNMRFGLSKEQLWAQCAASSMLLKYNVQEQLKKIKIPVFFIAGEMDIYIDHKKLPKLKELVSGPSELHIVKGATHTLSFTHPYHCWNWIDKMLKQYGLLQSSMPATAAGKYIRGVTKVVDVPQQTT